MSSKSSETAHFHAFETLENNTSLVSQFSYNITEDLPFPINLSDPMKNTLCSLLVIILITGLILRIQICCYIQSRDAKRTPINVLLWLDQLNGLFLSCIIVLMIVALALPFSIQSFLGNEFCHWVRLPSGLHLSGSVTWSCLTGEQNRNSLKFWFGTVLFILLSKYYVGILLVFKQPIFMSVLSKRLLIINGNHKIIS